MNPQLRRDMEDPKQSPSLIMLPLDSILAALATCLLYCLYRLRQSPYRRAFRDLRGPKAESLIWGNELVLSGSVPGAKYLEWHREFGHAYKLRRAFGREDLILTDPVAVHHILGQGVYAFPKPSGARKFFAALLGRGLLHSEKTEHSQQRKVLAPGFSNQAVKFYLPNFLSASTKAVDLILANTRNEVAEIDVAYYANIIALEAVAVSAFSFDLGLFNSTSGPHPLVQALNSLTKSIATHGISSFLIVVLLFTFPFILNLPLERSKRIKECRRLLYDITRKVLSDRTTDTLVRDEDGPAYKGRSILDILVQSEMPEGKKPRMTAEQISAQIAGLIFAGHETTATTLSWIIYHLSKNSNKQDMLREELMQVDDPRFEDFNDKSKLPVLDAVIKETLRLCPPILQLHRVATEDCIIPLSLAAEDSSTSPQLLIPKGTVITIPINVMQQSEELWPTDGHLWNPDRWSQLEGSRAGDVQFRYQRGLLAFSDGPRVCIGRTFAIIEMKAVLYVLLRRFKFIPATRNGQELPIEPFLSFVLRPHVAGEPDSRLPVQIEVLDTAAV